MFIQLKIIIVNVLKFSVVLLLSLLSSLLILSLLPTPYSEHFIGQKATQREKLFFLMREGSEDQFVRRKLPKTLKLIRFSKDCHVDNNWIAFEGEMRCIGNGYKIVFTMNYYSEY